MKSEELHTGRLLYAQTQNKITNDIKNIFSFYAKSHTTKADVKCIFEKIRKLVCENEFKNVIICGDFNFVTSLLDWNTNKFTSVDSLYKSE